MSKLIVAIATIALIGTFCAISFTSETRVLSQEANIEQLWNHWKLSYSKSYTAEEEVHRLASFTSNYYFVMNWNADPTQTSSVGLNEFADLTSEEFGALKGCLMPQPELPTFEKKSVTIESKNDREYTPFDWANRNAVTPVKNQGQCGSCWAFSTTGSLEGLNAITNNVLQSFSEQQLVDCSGQFGNEGCNGGWPFWAMEYTAQNGIELESVYPYDAEDGTCDYEASNVVFTNQGYSNVTNYDQEAMMAQIQIQPLSVCVEADQSVFQLYTGGVITSASCGTQLDHAILATGYDVTPNGQPYWIVKNSWGTSWGNAGYVWIARSDSETGPGICGIAMNVAYPTA